MMMIIIKKYPLIWIWRTWAWRKIDFATWLVTSMVLFASVVSFLTALMALYYWIRQSENVKLFTIPYFLTALPIFSHHQNPLKHILELHSSQTTTIFFHVYSLNADFWTQIIDTTIHHSDIRLFSRFEGFYFNGVHYWNGFLDYGDTNELGQACDCEIVLAFDMSRDVFLVIRLPNEVFQKLMAGLEV